MTPSFKKPSADELKKRLTEKQFEVTQNEGTEAPFKNEYWDNKEAGIYVDVVSGEPLFSSLDKFDSGSGWPSFTRPLDPSNIWEKSDDRLAMKRVEVRSRGGNSHLGHLFNDGPAPTQMRYCINSASLRFIPVRDLEKQGYGRFLPLFQTKKREVATFSAGCFWGVEEIIRQVPGVLETMVGYTGGSMEHPGYSQVKTGKTGHAEAVQVVFDPEKITYAGLLKYFFRLHDPTTRNRQGNDVGSQYRSSIFYHNEEQRKVAESVKAEVEASGKWKAPIVTEIRPAAEFYPAEDYHQKYLVKNPGGYTCHYLRE